MTGESSDCYPPDLTAKKRDALTQLPKPAVRVRPGTLVATAESILENPGQWECLYQTAMMTPIGKICILRARTEAAVVLAGPSKNSEVRTIAATMAELGAQCIFVDGAFDRQSAADPLIARQVILASGASLVSDITALVERTKCRVEQLTLPACGQRQTELAQRARKSIARLVGGQFEEIRSRTALLDCSEWAPILRGCEFLFIKGALGDGLGEALLQQENPPQVILQDGSKIFLAPGIWRRLRQKSVSMEVEKAINLLGVTVNPACPGGTGLNPAQLLERMGRELYPMPVLDVMLEARYWQ